MIYLIIVLFLFWIERIILFFEYKATKPGFDHFFHLSLIRTIKDNKHRFVLKPANFIVYDNFMYPQFYHWILSFLPIKFIEEKYYRIGQFINFMVLICFIAFSYIIYGFIDFQISKPLFVLYSGIIFTVSPFNYLLWNAKNRGLSVRNFGIFLVNLYLYFIVLMRLLDSNWFYLPIFLIVFIILLSNQFSFQFVLISSILLAVLYRDIFLLLPPFVALVAFIIFFRKIAISYLKGQYYHKMIWQKYLVDDFVLKSRYSIYRDFVWDFWKKRDIKYILNNPIISVVLGFPFLSCIIWFLIEKSSIIVSSKIYFILIPILVSITVFIITSFRFTRFLGEPERYVEFALPFISVLSIFFLQSYIWLLIIIICFSFLYLIYYYSLFGFDKEETNFYNCIDNFKKIITEDKNDVFCNVFSNNISILNFFLENKQIKILSPNITSYYTGSIHIKDIFTDGFPYVNRYVLNSLIDEFRIEWFILDTMHLKEEEFILLQKNNFQYEKKFQHKHLILYYIKR